MAVLMSASDVTLILLNANVLTMQRNRHPAEAVAVADDRIVAVGSNFDIRLLSSAHTQTIHCHGLTLLPGFNDAHCHLPGLARRLQDLDCGPQRALSIPVLLTLVRQWAAARPAGRWVRGHGYDDLRMADRRHPNRWDLDVAAPENPVWLEHRSGHASALNSRALDSAGIHRETPDPPGGVIERDFETGEPTGVLFEMRSYLRQRLGNTRSPQEFEDGMRAAGQLLSSYGITSVQDAGADNGIERWESLQQLQSGGALSCRITMFAGVERLDELAAIPSPTGGGPRWGRPAFGSGNYCLRLGHAKIMLTLTSGALSPSAPELATLVADAHSRGFPVAIHCIEEEAISAAAEVLAATRHPALTDRLEHCAEGTPHLVDAVRMCGAAVVTNPGFLYHHGASYREHVEPRLLPHLYPAGELHRAGIAVAFGSDAPVIDPNPWPAIYSAVTRCDRDGKALYGSGSDASQRVGVETALRMHTIAGAIAEGRGADKGTIAPGKLADMVLVNTDPLTAEPEDLAGVETVMTVVGGRVVWNKV